LAIWCRGEYMLTGSALLSGRLGGVGALPRA